MTQTHKKVAFYIHTAFGLLVGLTCVVPIGFFHTILMPGTLRQCCILCSDYSAIHILK
jgi:hypothetical protein